MRRLSAAFACAFLVAAGLVAPGVAVAAEQVVSIPGGRAALYGTLERPDMTAAPGPAVLLWAGSGPTDRDGNSAAGGAPNELKQLADTLAGAGIASLRTDKRGIGASAAAAPAEVDMRLSTYVDDAAAWATWLKGQPGVKCVVLAGHSEGVLIALLAAQKVSVCGVVSLEGAGRSLAEVLKDQLQHGLQEPLRAQALAAVDQLAAGKTVVDPPPQLASMFRPSVQPYMISELSVDPAAEARKLRGPLLLVQGDRDQQVTLVDFERLKAVRPDAATLLVPGMIHPLKVVAPVPGQTVNLTNLPLAPGVGETVVKFVKGL